MSTAFQEQQAAAPVRVESAPPVAPAAAPRSPLVWLLGILAVGLALRCWTVAEPMQLDEFPALYAVADRGDPVPTADEPLRPVQDWEEVRDRSVLPYGIVNPHPLYHYGLYAVVNVLPIAEWSLRLPSLLAGLACIAGVYWICRRLIGSEVALVAALLVAVDPIQVAVSDLVRPYALANLACVLSFLALLGLLRAHKLALAALYVVGYGVAVAFIGYLNPVLLLVVVAHLGVAAFGLFQKPADTTRGCAWSRFAGWLAGVALAAGLLSPQFAYFAEVGRFSHEHREYLFSFGELRLSSILAHNGTFLVALLVVSLASYVARQIQRDKADGDAAEPADPPAESQELVWVGRTWLFWPQMVCLVLAYSSSQAIYLSRYMSYTTLGAAILIAYWATRDRSKDVRLGVSVAVVLSVFLWGFLPISKGAGLLTPMPAQLTMRHLDELEAKEKWKPGDVVLVRSGFLEADFLPDRIPEATRGHVERALLSPYTTLYVSKNPKPLVLLSKSHYRSDKLHTDAGTKYPVERRYDEELARQLRGYDQFWLVSNEDGRAEFLACFLPWLADALKSDLSVARNRTGSDRYFDVYTDSAAEDYLEGLSRPAKTDFTHLIRVQRRRPPWAIKLGAFAANPAGLPAVSAAVPGWFLAQERTPRVTMDPVEDLAAQETGRAGP